MYTDEANVISVFVTMFAQYLVFPCIQYCFMSIAYEIRSSYRSQDTDGLASIEIGTNDEIRRSIHDTFDASQNRIVLESRNETTIAITDNQHDTAERSNAPYDTTLCVNDQRDMTVSTAQIVTEKIDSLAKEDNLYDEVSYVRITSLQCYICLFIYIPVLVYGVAKKNAEDKETYLSVILVACSSTGIVLCVIWTQIESIYSWEMQYLENIQQKQSCLNYLDILRELKPTVEMTITCFHYEQRTGTTTTYNSDGTRTYSTYTYTVRIDDHQCSENFQYDMMVDKSRDPLSLNLDSSKLTRVRIPREINFGDDYTINQFNKQKSDFMDKVSAMGNWQNMEFTYVKLLDKYEPRICSSWDSVEDAFWMTDVCYCCFNLLCCSWCYRLAFNLSTQKIVFYLKKDIFCKPT